ncbi:putative nuclease HARBI1 [Tanacetum coccineum]
MGMNFTHLVATSDEGRNKSSIKFLMTLTLNSPSPDKSQVHLSLEDERTTEFIIEERARRAYRDREREQGGALLMADYFVDNPTFNEVIFRRRFRMRKHLFVCIVDVVTANNAYFQQRRDATGRQSLSSLQKCTGAMRVLAYGISFEAVDEYLRMSGAVTRKSLMSFIQGVISCFGDEYLRRPNEDDLARLLNVGEQHGFPEMESQPSFWKPLRHMTYGYDMLSLEHQAVRKDVERAFGVLQARFAFLRHPCLIWDYEQMGQIMIACIIMHNMIVEDERETYRNYDPSEFFNDTHTNGNDDVVEYSTERIADLRSYMRNREQLRNREAQSSLQNDLIEHIWQNFGDDN